MESTPVVVPESSDIPVAAAPHGMFRKSWYSIRARILGGLVFVLPIVITLWVIYWIYSRLERYLIDPIALLLLRKMEGHEHDTQLPYWFEMVVAPLIAIFIALLLLYVLGFFVRSRVQGMIDWVLLRLPGISIVYKGVRNVFQTLERKRGQARPQRVVLVPYPHSGLRVPGFVTATCRDIDTQRTLLCVWVPTSPMPTVGYVLIVPEDDVTELNWTAEQTVQTLLSSGLAAPPEIRYSSVKPAIPHTPAVGDRPDPDSGHTAT